MSWVIASHPLWSWRKPGVEMGSKKVHASFSKGRGDYTSSTHFHYSATWDLSWNPPKEHEFYSCCTTFGFHFLLQSISVVCWWLTIFNAVSFTHLNHLQAPEKTPSSGKTKCIKFSTVYGWEWSRHKACTRWCKAAGFRIYDLNIYSVTSCVCVCVDRNIAQGPRPSLGESLFSTRSRLGSLLKWSLTSISKYVFIVDSCFCSHNAGYVCMYVCHRTTAYI